MNGAAGLCVVIVIALSIIAAIWTAAASATKTQKHRPQIWCDDTRQRLDGNGGWPLCELKLREA
jgi:hypothetical protein